MTNSPRAAASRATISRRGPRYPSGYRRLALAALCCLLLAACGQKGDLYLPHPDPSGDKPAEGAR